MTFSSKTRRIRGSSLDAPKTDVTRRRVDRLRVARRRPIPSAIVRRAKVRAALNHLAWDPDVRETAVVTVLLAAAARVLWNAASLRRVGRMPGRVPVGRPLPDVADHVVEAVAVGRVGGYRGGALIAVAGQVLLRENALPCIGQVAAAGCEFTAPRVFGA